MGRLIAIDGVDASGKETQTKLLSENLQKRGHNVRRLSFPMYDKPSSTLVKEYLSGKYGENPSDVNAYSASILFAADRFSSYRTDWIKDYNSDTIIIADRYVSSNMIHQAGKIEDLSEKKAFLEWVYDLEYVKLGLPMPEVTIFLDMPIEYGIRLMRDRANKIDGEKKLDIHESNREYLEKSYSNAIEIAKMYDFKKISCVENGQILSVSQIQNNILKTIDDINRNNF